MTAQQVVIWSCHRRAIRSTRVERQDACWRVTLVLECGHEAAQDFKFVRFDDPKVADAAARLKEIEARRYEIRALAADRAPCIVCGPVPRPA